MNQCPVCSSPIEDSFGLIECPSCHKILFAEFDGTLRVHNEESSSDGALEASQLSKNPIEELIPVHEIPEEIPGADFNNDWNLINESVPPLDALDPVVSAEDKKLVSEIEAMEESLEVEEPAVSEVIAEINKFASSEESNLKQGSLLYNLTIGNIDTEEIKSEILEVLRENRLNIDIKKLKFSLPTLELKDLNPVKASVIISGIKHLPVEITWNQRSVLNNDGSAS